MTTLSAQQKKNKQKSINGDKNEKAENEAKPQDTTIEMEKTHKRTRSDSPEKNLTKIAYSIIYRIFMSGKCTGNELGRMIPPEEMESFLSHVHNLFNKQPVCIEINGPVNICGDIHGQFSDLLRLFDKIGAAYRTNYLFLGDYVDRGKHCIEVVLLLFCYKIIFPQHFFLLRGNHECSMINRQYGFYDECQRRLVKSSVYNSFQTVFSVMPLTAIIGQRILCMHGGVSKQMENLNVLRLIKRPFENPDPNSLAIDILWSDPTNFAKGWTPNTRGVSYVFGSDVLRKLLDVLQIDLVVRAHQVVQDGYEFFANRRLVTIFSAPYYCGQFDNAAAVMHVTKSLICSFVILRPRKKIARRRMMPAATICESGK